MTNELTDVRCPCGDEYPADSYDAGFIAGSGTGRAGRRG